MGVRVGDIVQAKERADSGCAQSRARRAEITTPEVFAELKMQIQERGGKADYTDVVTIEAELLGIENNGNDYLASVKFTGQIKPAPDALAEPFNEVWNLVKPVSGTGGWLLGGIQQLA